MKPLMEHTGYGVALRRSDVDTDQIVPAEYCKRLTKSGYADVLFAGWREDPAFVLNRPASLGASILVAGHNFGTGSSREHAVWALRDWGFAAVIASSFGDIFRRNAFKNGLLAVELPAPVVAELADLVDADPRSEITVDLVDLEVRAGGLRHGFAVDQRARWLLLEGLDEIAVTLVKDCAITTYERSRPGWLPNIRTTSLQPVRSSTAEVQPR
ncbi:3-isopropylmalate dehydratase small subunit [Streptomyces sp. P9-2B-2]|uniref:3-isopropylmalate dehydratase small subunit n=1 Tax=Streptomyces sp. P9-2B-2 TaxID=3057114 RepID=UPI0025B398C6|nr:3-isopropylmalate dehydratase small subunit [Streptomyces sp. P9-2B-2]WJY37094.1 3-isopropylmalate dehydratase small subunit [Streptomyces sp. P9-2B-2]